jgi:hypothetical protein
MPSDKTLIWNFVRQKKTMRIGVKTGADGGTTHFRQKVWFDHSTFPPEAL